MILSPCPPPMLIFNGGNATDLIKGLISPASWVRGEEGRRKGGEAASLPAPCRETSFIAEIKVIFRFYF